MEIATAAVSFQGIAHQSEEPQTEEKPAPLKPAYPYPLTAISPT